MRVVSLIVSCVIYWRIVDARIIDCRLENVPKKFRETLAHVHTPRLLRIRVYTIKICG